MQDQPLLEVSGLRVAFPTARGYVEAVRGVDFSLRKGEIMSLVGESGSGKSITMRAVMGLLPPAALARGSVKLLGRELMGIEEKEIRRLRGSRMSMIFQDPLTALNPVLTVGDQLTEAIRIHQPRISPKEARERAIELFRSVAIPYPEKRMDQYPHEFSGGMRQRVVIAIAIANRPDLIIADEPTTALDVTVQAQVLELLSELCRVNNTGLVLITHDLGVVAGMAEKVSVMYAGSIVERSTVDDLFEHPRHPYTRGLLGSLPQMTGDIGRLSDIGGAPPTAATIPAGCAFNPRCDYAVDRCRTETPALETYGPTHVACHLAHTLPEYAEQRKTA
ncbi:ABC transporter ATP-binding protein [Rhizobium leguminosarum]|uniref:ABC transporter ATP-binding protein n=1 Tax=Rhizobium leguminosarum TaxID=384 RepID=UPI001C95DB2D|nr:ABC transporter ATP-binding protein [Rhizobium leguminosarum]MBY5406421.1 ABC transporter ATP-binding protein [Rhizobium leguminosarum]